MPFADGERVSVTFVENRSRGEDAGLLSWRWRDPWGVLMKEGQRAPIEYEAVLVLPFTRGHAPTGIMAKLTTSQHVWPPPEGRWPCWRVVKEKANRIFLKAWLNRSTDGVYREARAHPDGGRNIHVDCPIYVDHLEYLCELLPLLKDVIEVELGPLPRGKPLADQVTPEFAARLLEKHGTGHLRAWLSGLPEPPDDDYFESAFLANVAALVDRGQIPTRRIY